MSEFFVLLLRLISYLEGPAQILFGAPIFILITSVTLNYSFKSKSPIRPE